MAGRSSHSYKQYQRNQRKLVIETMYHQGMHYTDAPLPDGSIRASVNLIQKDRGGTLRPRGGWRQLTDPIPIGTHTEDLYIHHTGSAFVEDLVTDSTAYRRYALVLTKSETPGYGSTINSRVVVEDPDDLDTPLHVSTPVGTDRLIKHDDYVQVRGVHDLDLENPTPTGIFAMIEGNTYVLTPDGLGRLHLYFNQGEYTHEVKLVTPLDVNPGEAVNYGYNLLKPDPYHFTNSEGPTLQPHGIIPYDRRTNTIKSSARVGESVRFRLIYDYMADEEYKVQWEVQDITRRDGIVVIQDKEKSATYTNGQDIYIDYEPAYKQFSIICTIYEASDLTSPLRTMLLAAYHLADDSTNKIQIKEHDLLTAKGVCEWSNQMVYWGVKEAEMTLFISEMYDPTYVPFPHNAISFNERILKAFPYAEGLFVITTQTMYLVEFGDTGGFKSKPVQANLQLKDSDYMAMYSVRNLIFFKNNDQYFMVVPNIKNDRGELQIAPINNPVKMLFDDFKFQIYKVLSDTYTLTTVMDGGRDTLLDMKLADYCSYMDGSRVRNVYKIEFNNNDVSYYVDVHLIYDTVTRAWHIETVQTNRNRVELFQSVSTGYAEFLNIYTHGDVTYIQWLGIDEDEVEDEFSLDEQEDRIIKNYQMLDTGKRDMDGYKKKRFRECIFEVNNISNEDIYFNHSIIIDDQIRSDLYKYTVEHVTDRSADNFGQIYVAKDFIDPDLIEGIDFTDPKIVRGVTSLDAWILSASGFPEKTLSKVHLNVTGKGYYPRLLLMSRSSKLFEINSISWAYRDMNAR